MKSLTNGLACLRLLSQHHGTLPLAVVSRELKLPRSTAYRLLATLVAEGFLKPATEVGTYVAGPQLLASASMALATFDVRGIALPFMRELSAATTHSVYLMVRSGFEAVCIDFVPGNDGLHLSVGLGSRRDLHCSGIAKVFLPSLSRAERIAFLERPLAQHTGRTIIDAARLDVQIAEIEDAGHAMSTGEYVPGARSIGVPIYNHQSQIVAALGIGGSEQKLSDDVLPNVIARMKAAAGVISAQLGFAGELGKLSPAKRRAVA